MDNTFRTRPASKNLRIIHIGLHCPTKTEGTTQFTSYKSIPTTYLAACRTNFHHVLSLNTVPLSSHPCSVPTKYHCTSIRQRSDTPNSNSTTPPSHSLAVAIMPIPWLFSSTKDAVAVAESRDVTLDLDEATTPTTPSMTPSPAEIAKGLKRTHDQMYVVSLNSVCEHAC